MSEDKVHDLFPASCRLAIGSTDIKGTNTIEQWKVDEEFVTYYKPSEDERASANED